MGLVINKPLEQCTVAMVLNKLKIMPQTRDPAINPEKPPDPAINPEKPVFLVAHWQMTAALSYIHHARALVIAWRSQSKP